MNKLNAQDPEQYIIPELHEEENKTDSVKSSIKKEETTTKDKDKDSEKPL